jgi:hypothetical protein
MNPSLNNFNKLKEINLNNTSVSKEKPKAKSADYNY